MEDKEISCPLESIFSIAFIGLFGLSSKVLTAVVCPLDSQWWRVHSQHKKTDWRAFGALVTLILWAMSGVDWGDLIGI